MKTAAFQKAENKSQSMVTSLFNKNEDVSLAESHDNPFEMSTGYGFNFGNLKLHNSGSSLKVQPKLQINQPGDQYEQEANAMADKVMRISDQDISQNSFKASNQTLQRKCAACEKEEEEKKVQPKQSNNSSQSVAPPIVHDVLNSSSGKSMDNGIRSFMESRFNHDFSNVKIYDNAIAAKSAESINSLAYTSGNNVVFNSAQYNPHSNVGKKLLAHELTHTIQQSEISLRSPNPNEKNTSSAIIQSNSKLDRLRRVQDINRIGVRSVARQPIDPRHARGHEGEQEAGFQIYRAEDGWIIIEGPSGAGGHGVTNAGFDMVAYNTHTDQLDIVDNKSYKSSGNVSGATAIDPAQNLKKNLESLIIRLRSSQDVQGRVRVLQLLTQTNIALQSGNPIPNAVHLVVTGLGGQKTGVSGPLQQRGVEFKAPIDPKTRTALNSLNEYRNSLRRQLDLYSGEHKIQLDLINKPSVTGFFGFWTNRLYNTDPPLLMIWNNAFGALAAAENALKRQDFKSAFTNLMRARARYLGAYKQYSLWKDGIQVAGVKMQQTIALTAVAIVVVAVAPGIIAAIGQAGVGTTAVAGGTATAGGTAAIEQTLVRISALVAQHEAAVLAAEAAGTAADVAAEESLELTVEELESMAL